MFKGYRLFCILFLSIILLNWELGISIQALKEAFFKNCILQILWKTVILLTINCKTKKVFEMNMDGCLTSSSRVSRSSLSKLLLVWSLIARINFNSHPNKLIAQSVGLRIRWMYSRQRSKSIQNDVLSMTPNWIKWWDSSFGKLTTSLPWPPFPLWLRVLISISVPLISQISLF